MRAVDQNEMHKDHPDWNSEVAMWERDTRMWYKELEVLINALMSIKTGCEEHEKGLDTHLRTIKGHQHSLNIDESDLTMIDPSLSGYPAADVTARHNKESKQQQIQRDAHARLKEYHHLIMVVTKSMKKALAGPL